MAKHTPFDEFTEALVAAPDADAISAVVTSPEFSRLVPQMARLADPPREGYRHKNVLRHSIIVASQTPSDDALARWGGLLHDIGKATTRRYVGPPGHGSVSFANHDVVGARMISGIARHLSMPPEFAEDLATVVRLHMRPRDVKAWSDAAVRRYMTDAGPVLDALNQVARADVTSRYQENHDRVNAQMDLLERRIAEVRRADEVAARRPPIDGLQVAAYVGVEPGPALAPFMAALYERLHASDESLTISEAHAILDRVAATVGR